MSLKDLRDKFHHYDAKVSSFFHNDKDGMKKPSWGKIIVTWLGLIILLAVVSSVATSVFIVDVNQEITPVSSLYNLDYNSYKSSSYYITQIGGPNKDAYHISYDGKLKVELNTSDIPHSDYLEKILESYLNGSNEYNASVSVELTAYDSSDSVIKTLYYMSIDNDSGSSMYYKNIDLLLFKGLKFDFKDNIFTITSNGSDKRVSDSIFNDSLKNIDHINGVIYISNNALETSDPGFYNYTLNFTIPKSSINIKNA
ncbi:MAG: hypothetical protein FWH29_00630 [Methanobrevibacter sp.]|nr:hypothetical protein [Methanobrevibacter sp.]